MNAIVFPDTLVQLTGVSAGELFEHITPWINSAEAMQLLQGVVRLNGTPGTGFRCRLAIQTAVDPSNPGSPVAIDPANYVNAGGIANQKFYRFDPTGTPGDVDQAPLFRVGILYGLSTGTQAQASVSVLGLAWR